MCGVLKYFCRSLDDEALNSSFVTCLRPRVLCASIPKNGNNILDSQSRIRHPFPQRLTKRKNPVTIIVGIICKDAVVLASDSQTTSGTTKRTDTEKIIRVEFSNFSALVAQAGYATFSGQAIEIFTNLAKGKEITDGRMVAEMAEQTMRQLKDRIRYQQGDCTMEELRDFVWKHEMGCELMVAYYLEGKPHLFTIDMVVGIANKVNSYYEAIGCGANLGSYLLSEYAMPQMMPNYAATIAIMVVNTVKSHDAYCGGETKVGILHNLEIPPLPLSFTEASGEWIKSSFFEIYTSQEIEELSAVISSIKSATSKSQYEKFRTALVKRMEQKWAAKQTQRDNALRNALTGKLPDAKDDDKK
jgi:20S proteasome alpha/beta subunit